MKRKTYNCEDLSSAVLSREYAILDDVILKRFEKIVEDQGYNVYIDDASGILWCKAMSPWSDIQQIRFYLRGLLEGYTLARLKKQRHEAS